MKKGTIIRLSIGVVAGIVWYICQSKGLNPVVKEISALIAVICLFGKLIWRLVFSSKSKTSSMDNGSTSKHYNSETIIQPYYTDMKRAWKWNGEVLQPYYTDMRRAWKWDGEVLQPYYNDLQRAWKWDGKVLQPYYNDLQRAWKWDGEVLQPYYNDLQKAWKWNGKVMQPYYNDMQKAWKVEGDVNIPVLAKVIGLI